MLDVLEARYVYFLVLTLLAVGLHGLLAHRHLMKKLVALAVFQTAIYLFFIEGSVKHGANVPIVDPAAPPDAALYMNPLPHLLILTAIVVGVGVLGVGLALLTVIHRGEGTLDDERLRGRSS